MLPQIYLPTPHSNYPCTEVRNEGSSNRILIFSTNAMLHLLCDLDAIYVDGTFQVSPALACWHNRLKKIARKAHPKLFEFIEVIQKEQATAEVTIEQLSEAGRVRAKKSKVVRHEEIIMKLMEEFTGGIRTLESFLSILSHCVVSFDY